MVVWVAFLLHDNGGGGIILIAGCDKLKELPKHVKSWIYPMRIGQKYGYNENVRLRACMCICFQFRLDLFLSLDMNCTRWCDNANMPVVAIK